MNTQSVPLQLGDLLVLRSGVLRYLGSSLVGSGFVLKSCLVSSTQVLRYYVVRLGYR